MYMFQNQNDLLSLFMVMSTVFFCLSGYYLVLIIIKKENISRDAAIKSACWSQIQESLTSICIAPDESRADLNLLRRMAKKSSKIKQWILDEIIKQQANLSGESKTNLMQVYDALALKECSLEKLRSPKWNVKAAGIQELEEMGQVDCVEEICKLLRAKNKDLRKIARLALTSLSKEPLGFLKEVREELSEWERMAIAFRLRGKQKDQLQDFSIFYSHRKISVKLLCLHLSVYFNCFEHIPQLIDLLNTRSKRLLLATLEALNKLEAFQAIDAVMARLSKTRDIDIIVSSLKFLGSVGNPSCEHVIKQFIDHEETSVRMQAVQSAIELNLSFEDHSEEIRRMYAHHQNELIS